MPPHLWLRAETKPGERRTPLVPADALRLIEAEFQVTVEKSSARAFADLDYQEAGCALVAGGSWNSAPLETYILGIKELPASEEPLRHKHIYFAHAYKGQSGWRKLLTRFKAGRGALFDLEYLTDEKGRRVAAFGHWAGAAGMGVAVQTWCGQILGQNPPLQSLEHNLDKEKWVQKIGEELGRAMAKSGRKPTALILGAKGRCGQGACWTAEKLDLNPVPWDLEETRKGGPFSELLDQDILVNCVLIHSKIPAFLTADMLDRKRLLTVFTDVSCDPFSDFNPFPIYSQTTTLTNPSARLRTGPVLFDLVAVDHLPTLLPLDSSRDFSMQLTPHLLTLEKTGFGPWTTALSLFEKKSMELQKEEV